MWLKTFVSNASSIFLTFIVAILSSYWITIYHEIDMKDGDFLPLYIAQVLHDKMFMGVNVFLVLVVSVVVRNLARVDAINSKHIAELRRRVASFSTADTKQTVVDKLADLAQYFDTFDERDENGAIVAIQIRPQRLVTYFLSIKEILVTLKFSNGKYMGYTIEDPDGKKNGDGSN